MEQSTLIATEAITVLSQIQANRALIRYMSLLCTSTDLSSALSLESVGVQCIMQRQLIAWRSSASCHKFAQAYIKIASTSCSIPCGTLFPIDPLITAGKQVASQTWWASFGRAMICQQRWWSHCCRYTYDADVFARVISCLL